MNTRRVLIAAMSLFLSPLSAPATAVDELAPQRGKISCLDQRLPIPGLPLPVR